MSSSWRPAANKLIELVEGAPVDAESVGLGDKLRHDPRATLESPPATRRFFLDLQQGASRWPEEPGPFRWTKGFAFHFGYSARLSSFELAIAMGQDMESVTRRLLSSELWEESTTGIVALTLGGADALPWTTTLINPDLILVTLSGVLEHHDLP